MEPLMPFKYVIISPEDTSMKEGCIISELTKGIFLYIQLPIFYKYAKGALTSKES